MAYTKEMMVQFLDKRNIELKSNIFNPNIRWWVDGDSIKLELKCLCGAIRNNGWNLSSTLETITKDVQYKQEQKFLHEEDYLIRNHSCSLVHKQSL